MEGLKKVRNKFGEQAIDLAIISAKHGVLREFDVIKRYNCTFPKGKRKIKERSDDLHIHEDTEALIKSYDLVFFLLHNEYVEALQLPFDAPDTVTQLFLLGEKSSEKLKNQNRNSPNAHFIPHGEDIRYKLGLRTFKAVVFKRLCSVACLEGFEVFERIRKNPQQIFDFIGCSA